MRGDHPKGVPASIPERQRQIAEQWGTTVTPHAVGVRLEEVESTRVGSEDAWLITLSMIDSGEPVNNIAALLGKGKREYKSFIVLKGNGEVTSMKIRELADV